MVHRSIWRRVVLLAVRWPVNLLVILAVLCVLAPLGYAASTIRRDDSIVLDIPRGSVAAEAYAGFIHDFGFGAVLRQPARSTAIADATSLRAQIDRDIAAVRPALAPDHLAGFTRNLSPAT